MKRIPAIIALSAAASAQDGATPAQDAATQRLEQLLRAWQLQQDASPWRQQLLERRAAEQRRREFVEKANRFVAIWKKMMDDYARNGTFDVKKARALSKAFRELEATGWPK